MNVNFIIITVFVVFSGCFTHGSMNMKVINSAMVEIKLRLPPCLKTIDTVAVSFDIVNNDSIGFWIQAWYLDLVGVVDTIGQNLEPLFREEEPRPNIPEYTFVPAGASLSIEYKTGFFRRFRLEKGQTYHVVSIYNGRVAKKGTEDPTLLRQMELPLAGFQLCD